MMKRYLMNTGGNVAMIFAVAVTAIVIAVGAAVDYSGMSSQSSKLQSFVDAATLAAAKAGTKNQKELEDVVKATIDFHNKEGWIINTDVIVGKEDIRIVANLEYDTAVMGVVGKDKMPITVDAAAPLSNQTPVNLAMVLDTTGSMAGTNMSALITASEDMLDTLDEMEAKIQVSMVPFGQYVNVGLDQKGQNWLDTSKDGTTEEYEYCWTDVEWEEAPVCTETGRTITSPRYTDGVYTGDYSYQETTCTDGVKASEEQICEMRTTTFEWHGCVNSRSTPNHKRAAFGAHRVPAHYNDPSTCGQALIPLTEELDQVKTSIGNLEAKGETYLPAGLIWGWRTLNPQVPFTQAAEGKDKDRVEAILLMTDGGNTRSLAADGEHDAGDATAGLNLTREVCDEIKKDKIQIFTVAYNMPGGTEDTKEVLRYCASSPSQSFDPENAAQLKQSFKQVANMLDLPRLLY